jgi:D-glycero-alpha-D-manno-heptose 1-phosphate guanylyltransferase
VDVESLAAFHEEKNPVCSLALKPMQHFDRYGVVEIDSENIITTFHEKKLYTSGLINGGVYILDTKKLSAYTLPEKFSFEKDYLQKYYPDKIFYGAVRDNYFIDIGIPEDYYRAQAELKYIPPDLKAVDTSWTLFIDRDGVINPEKQGDYIRNRDEFRFYNGVKESLKMIAEKFGRIIVVSNQRGVGKGLMTEADLSGIHQKMMAEITAAGGRVDKIYYCTSTDTKHFERKPNPGMALKAKKDFPEIDFSRSIMIGNNSSDMLFGRNAGIYTVFLKTTKPEQVVPHPDIDLALDSLTDFAKACLPTSVR